MSSLHDALRDRIRSRPGANGSARLSDSEGNTSIPILLDAKTTGNAPHAPIPPFVGTLTKIRFDPKTPLIWQAVDSGVIEHYRTLRTKILQQQTAKMFRTLVVTSPNPDEGKTVTVLNVGLSLAMLPSFQVLLVDGDLRKGSLGKCSGVDGRLGLSNFLEGSARLKDTIFTSEDIPIHFMPRGTSTTPAAELLQVCDLKSKFQELAERFSLVLVDSPPANLMADVQLLAASCDALLLVVRAFTSNRRSIERAARDISQFRVIGTVLNRGISGVPYYRYYKYSD